MQRNPWLRVAVTVAAMAAVLLLAASWRYLVSRGVFTSVEAKQTGQCRMLASVGAVEDIAVDNDKRVFIATSDGLYYFAGGQPVRISGTPKSFHLSALAVSQGHDGDPSLHALFRQEGVWKISVFTVHLREADSFTDKVVRPAATAEAEKSNLETVVLSRPIPPKIEELGRLSTDVLTDPAALAALDANRFYLVNRHKSRTALGRWLDDTFLLPRAEVLYFDGMKFVTVAKGLNSPAGIALSPDAAHLYVSEDYPRTLVTFARNEFTGATNNATVLSIASGLGKIHAAKDGSLIIAARPKKGMGQVWRVKDGAAELLYARRDSEIAAAAQSGRHLFIGASDGLTDCFQ